MAICPFATWRPVTAHGGPISTILGVVIHVTAGEGDPYNEFINSANGVSSHFGIGDGLGGMPDGLIEQYVDTDNESWAQVAGNATYLSVETEGEPGTPLTEAQIASFARIMAWANQTYGVPLVTTDTPGQRGLICHGDGGVAWGNHPDCPGPDRTAQRVLILEQAQAILSPEVPNMNATDPTSGGFWVFFPSDGHIETYGGAPYLGAFNSHAGTWTPVGSVIGFCAQNVPASGGWGYNVTCALSAPNAAGEWCANYFFPRNGSAKA